MDHIVGSKQTLTVSIGRNVTDRDTLATRPMYSTTWESFRNNVTLALHDVRAEILFIGTGLGLYQGQSEESATWVATVVSDTTSSNRKVADLEASLKDLARFYDQECIALTIGRTTLCNSDGTVYRIL